METDGRRSGQAAGLRRGAPLRHRQRHRQQGDRVDELRILRAGNLRVGRSYQANRLAEFPGPLGPGNAVSELSFLDGGGASATLIADGDVELFAAPSAGIDALIEADPSFAGRLYLSLFVELARKLRATNQPVLPIDQ